MRQEEPQDTDDFLKERILTARDLCDEELILIQRHKLGDADRQESPAHCMAFEPGERGVDHFAYREARAPASAKMIDSPRREAALDEIPQRLDGPIRGNQVHWRVRDSRCAGEH